jgi:hypothetical protein
MTFQTFIVGSSIIALWVAAVTMGVVVIGVGMQILKVNPFQ